MDEEKRSSSSYEEEIAALTEELRTLTTKCTKLSILVSDYGLMDKLDAISDTEAICTEQIRKLRDVSRDSVFNQDDAKILDILHKNLKMARGEKTNKTMQVRTKKMSDGDLLKLIKD